jgi:hypothetical protein
MNNDSPQSPNDPGVRQRFVDRNGSNGNAGGAGRLSSWRAQVLLQNSAERWEQGVSELPRIEPEHTLAEMQVGADDS